MILDTIYFSLVTFEKLKMGDLNVTWKIYERMCNRGFEINSLVIILFTEANYKERRIRKQLF